MNTATQRASSRTTAIFLRYGVPAYFAVDTAFTGWHRTGELRLLYFFQAVVALVTLAVRRYSIEYSRYCLGYAVGAEAAVRALRLLRDPPPPNHPAGLYMALALLFPALVLLFDAWVLRMLDRLSEAAQAPVG
jgi:hypothetical protein